MAAAWDGLAHDLDAQNLESISSAILLSEAIEAAPCVIACDQPQEAVPLEGLERSTGFDRAQSPGIDRASYQSDRTVLRDPEGRIFELCTFRVTQEGLQEVD